MRLTPMHRFWLLAALALAGCPATNMPPDAFMRDAGPPDPDASMNCRAVDLLPAGTYWIGSDSTSLLSNVWNMPAHQVVLSRDAWVMRFEASHACFDACVDADGCPAQSPLIPGFGDPARRRWPAAGIEYDVAQTYCTWLGGRLLTSAEWEAMARGADGRRYPWDPTPADPRNPEAGPLSPSDQSCALANWNFGGGLTCVGRGSELSPVDAFPDGRGPFGHHNVIGNAGEWVRGSLTAYTGETQTDPLVEVAADLEMWGQPSRIVSLNRQGGEGVATARCLFTSPPEPLYVEE